MRTQEKLIYTNERGESISITFSASTTTRLWVSIPFRRFTLAVSTTRRHPVKVTPFSSLTTQSLEKQGCMQSVWVLKSSPMQSGRDQAGS